MFLDESEDVSAVDNEKQKTTTKKKAPVKKNKKEELIDTADTAEVAPVGNIIDLPSKGQFGYPATVEFRDMMAKDEEVLATTTVETYTRTLNGVLKSVLNDCEFYETLSIQDRDFALINTWSHNYSPKKVIEIECEHCGETGKQNIDLTQLEVSSPQEGFTGAFKLPIKNGEDSIVIRLNTVGDELAAEAFLVRNKDHRFDYLMTIQSIDVGVPMMLDQKIKWVQDNLTAREMAIVRQFHKEFDFGVKTILEHKCAACGGGTQYQLPFSVEDILNPTVSYNFGNNV